MFRNAYQHGFLTVFFSAGSNPLSLWDTHVKNGYMNRFLDQELKALVFEIGGNNVSTTYMTCPKGKRVLGIIMPFMIMIVKNLKKYFSFEVTILDDGGSRRRFRMANFQSTTLIQPLCTVMPIGLADGWNQIQFNLADFTRRAYNKQFLEVLNLKINANIRLRRIYFAERLVCDDELPREYKLYLPLSLKGKVKRTSKIDKENVPPATSQNMLEEGRHPSEKKIGSKDISKEEVIRKLSSQKDFVTANLTEAETQILETRRVSSEEKRRSKDINKTESLKSLHQKTSTANVMGGGNYSFEHKGSELLILKQAPANSTETSLKLEEETERTSSKDHMIEHPYDTGSESTPVETERGAGTSVIGEPESVEPTKVSDEESIIVAHPKPVPKFTQLIP